MKKIALILALSFAFVSCNNDDDNTPVPLLVTIDLTQNWDGDNVTESDFGTTNYTNAHGENLKISKLRYLISKVILHNSYGDEIEISGYQLADLTNNNSLRFAQNLSIPGGTYTSISFVYGFNEEDNISNEYQDLNTASWNWPSMLGGGYHFMQFEGSFTDSNGDPQPFAYHNGTARVSEGVFEENFITVTKPISFSEDSTIDIKMNLAEWFKNPYTWDLNTYSSALMGNYDAQILMNDNGQNVFDVTVEAN